MTPEQIAEGRRLWHLDVAGSDDAEPATFGDWIKANADALLAAAEENATLRASLDDANRDAVLWSFAAGYSDGVLAFFRSVIQAGEPWTDDCEARYAAAREATEHARAALTEPSDG
jgi:hypothetical protein